jgi:hypothetical protein
MGPFACEVLKRTLDNTTSDFNRDPVKVVFANVDRAENLKQENYYKVTSVLTFMIRVGHCLPAFGAITL